MSTKTTPVLDPSLYSLDEESVTFFKSQTGIDDDDELRKHIMKVQAQAYAITPYPCIRSFNFTRLKISRLPAYESILKLGREREGALLLDIGCCFGNDARKAAVDGFPVRQIIASDLRPEFWQLGHELFGSTPISFPATFIPGDVLNPAFISPVVGGIEAPVALDLSSINTLNDLRGSVSAIHASAFFHLFSEKNQRQVAHALGTLLSRESGSVIFGAHVAKPEKGFLVGDILGQEVKMFCHDPSSWTAMWTGAPVVESRDEYGQLDGPVFSSECVKVATTMREVKSETGEQAWILAWSVTRI